ncbi:MAG: NAD(P)-dependent oxidoreductase [Candidatus Sericytochromatia bacterium]|nr:NAD(P)-dependent oxidoreductase [Candidatus Tanganyikabacteria bacterium]
MTMTEPGSTRPASKFAGPRNKVPELPVAERMRSFREVQLGYTPGLAQAEASRCILCADEPSCEVSGCPLHGRIRDWLKLTAEGKFLEAALLSRTTGNIPGICGRICPQERLCEGACVVGAQSDPVAIGAIETFLADYLADHLDRGGKLPADLVPRKAAPTGKRIAVVGGGPAGISCAEQLLMLGHKVTVFDRWPRLGGLLRYGIPAFKLSPAIVDRKEKELAALGLEFAGNTEVGTSPTLQELLARGFDAVFIGVGAPVDTSLSAPGAGLEGIVTATSFLVRGNVPRQDLPSSWRDPLDVKDQEVVVLGGGDTAMDCLRTALRLQARKVTCVYRRDEASMPGARREQRMAREEGVEFVFLASPHRFHGAGGRILAVECQRMELGAPDASGRRAPVPIQGETFRVNADTVVLALGYDVEDTIPSGTPGLQYDKRFRIQIDHGSGATSLPGVFAGGDVTSGADLLVNAVMAGRNAAAGIHAYVTRR